MGREEEEGLVLAAVEFRDLDGSAEGAAELVAPKGAPGLAGAIGARQWLETEQLLSGIIISRGPDLKFWHLTFQEFLAAKLLSTKFEDPRLRMPFDADYWVRIENFEIGKFPVTVWEYSRFVEDGGARPDDWDQQLLRARRFALCSAQSLPNNWGCPTPRALLKSLRHPIGFLMLRGPRMLRIDHQRQQFPAPPPRASPRIQAK